MSLSPDFYYANNFILNIYFLFRFTIQIKHLYTFLYILTIEESLNWCRKSSKSFVLFALYHITTVSKISLMGTSSRSEIKVRFVGHKRQHKVFIFLSISFKFNPVFRKKETQICFMKEETFIHRYLKHSHMTAYDKNKTKHFFITTNYCTYISHNIFFLYNVQSYML